MVLGISQLISRWHVRRHGSVLSYSWHTAAACAIRNFALDLTFLLPLKARPDDDGVCDMTRQSNVVIDGANILEGIAPSMPAFASKATASTELPDGGQPCGRADIQAMLETLSTPKQKDPNS